MNVRVDAEIKRRYENKIRETHGKTGRYAGYEIEQELRAQFGRGRIGALVNAAHELVEELGEITRENKNPDTRPGRDRTHTPVLVSLRSTASTPGWRLSRREQTTHILHDSRNRTVHETYSRRAVLAGGASTVVGALAGCLGQDNDANGETPSNLEDDDPNSSGSDGAQAPFGDWLVTPESISELRGDNRVYRFSYSSFLIEQTLQNGRASVLDIDPAAVDGFLIQTPALIFLGAFDRAGLETILEDMDGYTLTGEYESYRTAENAETGTQFALGDEAVLIGRDLELWIDARTGEDRRLEETTPVFTRLFDRLPRLTTSVVGQLGPPQSFDVDLDGLKAWVNSTPEPVPGKTTTQRWVYAFDEQPSEDTTRAIEQELSGNPLIDEVTETTVDSAFLTVTGESTLPESDN